MTRNSLNAHNHRQKVVVVGAGLAGLTTAYRLHKKGFDVAVYEARNRVGGRIFTALVDGHIAELGAQNIANGGVAENIRKLIHELNLELVESKKKLATSYFTGNTFISDKELLRQLTLTPQLLRSHLARIAARSKNMRDVLKELCPEGMPLYKLLRAKLAGWEGADVEKLSSSYSETLYYILLGGMSSSQAHQDSDGLFIHLSITEGNSSLPVKLAQALANKVHTAMPITSISKSAEGLYILDFNSGSTALADILVLAIPCSVYRNIVFQEGTIPEEQLSAIKSVAYGTNAKIVVPLSTRFKDKGELIDDRVIIFPNADQTTLNLYYIGDAGFFSAQTISKAYLQEHALLKAGFGAESLPLIEPILARDELWAAYEGPVGHSWPNDHFVRGSYSYIAPGQEDLLKALTEHKGETTKRLFAPIDHKLYFAGEHASILMDVPGTMEAACESGERVARMIGKIIR